MFCVVTRVQKRLFFIVVGLKNVCTFAPLERVTGSGPDGRKFILLFCISVFVSGPSKRSFIFFRKSLPGIKTVVYLQPLRQMA